MSNLLELIEKRSEKLYQNSLCRWITGEETKNLPPQEVLAFAPAMLYFIMGFKDILENLEYTNPKDEFESMVNQHCLEDKDHWRWFLEDLKTLGFTEESWGSDLASKVENLWSESQRPTRELVYLCIYLIKKFRSANASLVIIECLEATFGVFMTTLQKKFWSSPAYTRLQFFGQTHHQQESNHSMGNWIEDEGQAPARHAKLYWESLKFSAEEEAELMTAVQLIFEQFEAVFQSWFDSRTVFLHPQAIEHSRQSELS